MKSTSDSTKTATVAANPVFKTFGEVFADGSLIEVVRSAAGDLNLLFWDGQSLLIAPQVEHGGRIYQVQELSASMMQATRLPRGCERYGTDLQLFAELRDGFEERLAFSRSLAEVCTFWVLSTWFSDCVLNPPSLWASGADIDVAADFIALLHCICRRGIKLTGVTRAGFLALPLGFRQSLLVHQPALPRGLQALWCESNFRGLVVPGSKGAALEVASSKAVFLGMFGFAPPPSAGNLVVALFPPSGEVPPLDDRTLNEVADYFQPRLQQYRLDHADGVRESRFTAPGLRFPISELARKLGACIPGDADLALQIVPLLSGQDDTINRCNLDYAIVEILWPRLHSDSAKTKNDNDQDRG